VANRELTVLGTASQVPTRTRNHNGYVLRWDDEVFLFDPGEGTQRQLVIAGVRPTSITAICITHLHGDHCLGLPGVLARFALDDRERPVDLYFPASGLEHIERLRHAAVVDVWPHLRLHPLPLEESGVPRANLRLVATPLEHRVDTLGWRIEEPAGRRMLPERLAALGIHGENIGRLVRTGSVELDGRRVLLDEVSTPRPGQRFAFVMDTGPCDAAVRLAEDADLAVCESTFLSPQAEEARRWGHMTAREAAQVASAGRAHRLALTHYSQRYDDETAFADEAGELFPDVVALRDLMTVVIPPRPPTGG
jgi:ribonuclease Z